VLVAGLARVHPETPALETEEASCTQASRANQSCVPPQAAQNATPKNTGVTAKLVFSAVMPV
jgi:hypothetical protein